MGNFLLQDLCTQSSLCVFFFFPFFYLLQYTVLCTSTMVLWMAIAKVNAYCISSGREWYTSTHKAN